MVELRESSGLRVYHNLFAIRPQLSTTGKRIAEVVENPDGSSERDVSATLTLNAAGTQLTVVNSSRSGSSASGNISITGVYAQ